MRYTRWDPDLERYVVPCLYKAEGGAITFHIKTGETYTARTAKGVVYTGKEPDAVFGEVIDKLAKLENEEERKNATV